jgi:2-polyprenyl-3-methyl-5-hydroxy-6-metoxy-1,4-benzoquinol methylase
MLPDLTQRSAEAEIMDAGIDSFREFDRCLQQIEGINVWTGGYRPVFLWLADHHLVSVPASRPLTIMDIGCGRGELLRRIRGWAQSKKINIQLTGIDSDPRSKPAAERATPADLHIYYQTKNILESGVTLKHNFIICSHVTHHFRKKELVQFLQWLDAHATSGWFIIDLHRHIIPYFFIKIILALIPVNAAVRNDGPVSVKRAFTRNDWRQALQEAGIPLSKCRVRWFFPFRYGIDRRMEDGGM